MIVKLLLDGLYDGDYRKRLMNHASLWKLGCVLCAFGGDVRACWFACSYSESGGKFSRVMQHVGVTSLNYFEFESGLEYAKAGF